VGAGGLGGTNVLTGYGGGGNAVRGGPPGTPGTPGAVYIQW
jgi:hypothetical protein